MAKPKITPETNTQYVEWVNQEVDGRFRGERFPAGACCAECGRRPTIADSALCGRCFDTTPIVPGTILESCRECGYPLAINPGQVPADRRCRNPACPEIIKGIYIRVMLAGLTMTLVALGILYICYHRW